MDPLYVPPEMQLTPVQVAYKRIVDAVGQALTDGVSVHVGGNPAVVQITKGDESYTFRTVPTGTSQPPRLVHKPQSPAAVSPAAQTGSHELSGPSQRTPVDQFAIHAPAMGYTGNVCKCGSHRVVRRGACEYCEDCGQSGGCS